MFCVLKNDKLVIECEKEETALFYICTDSKIEVRKTDDGYAFHKKDSEKSIYQVVSDTEADAIKMFVRDMGYKYPAIRKFSLYKAERIL